MGTDQGRVLGDVFWQQPKGFLCSCSERGEHSPGEHKGWAAEHRERNHIFLKCCCSLGPGGPSSPQTKPGFSILGCTGSSHLSTAPQVIILWSKGNQVLTEGGAGIVFQVRNISQAAHEILPHCTPNLILPRSPVPDDSLNLTHVIGRGGDSSIEFNFGWHYR